MTDPDPISRRQLLRLAGSVGVASMISACISDTRTTSTRLTASTAAQLICRDAWGARPPRPGGKRHTITRMTLHHEAVVLGNNRNAPERLRKDQRYHQDQHGWIDIAYHVGVDRNGNLYELRSTEIANRAGELDPSVCVEQARTDDADEKAEHQGAKCRPRGNR